MWMELVRKKFFTLFFLAVIILALGLTGLTSDASTAPSITWSRTYASTGLREIDSLLQTGDNGFLLAGITSGGTSQATYIELAKVDSSGNVQWNKTYEGQSMGMRKVLVQTSDGNYAIAGEVVLTSQQKVGFWLAKINPNGDIIWTKTSFGEGFGWAQTLIQTNDGGDALAGPTHADTHIIVGDMNIGLIKTDPMGNQQWSKTVGTGNANSMIQTADGGYALATYSTTADFQLTITDSTGTIQWSKNYGGQDKNSASSVIQTSDGGFVVGGSTWLRSDGGGFNLAIVKTDPSGNELWKKYYGAGFMRGLLQARDEGFVVINNPLVKVDAEGNKQWELSLGNKTEIYSGIQTQNSGYAVAGATNANGARGGWMAVISSTDSSSSNSPTPTVPEITALASALMAMLIGAIVVTLARFKTKVIGE
jgi:hypothetical protein